MLRKFAAAIAVLFLALTGTLAHAQAGPGGNVNNAVGLWGQNTSTGLPCVVAPTASGSANCALPIAATPVTLGAWGDPTGLAKTGIIINDDTFEKSARNWTQLFTPPGTGAGQGPNPTMMRIVRGLPQLSCRSPNVANLLCMGIKRMSNPYGDGRYLVEFQWVPEYDNGDTTRPEWFGFGLDTARLSDGDRSFFHFRYLNWNAGTSLRGLKFQLQTGTSTWVDTGCTLPAAQTGGPANNENKSLPIYIAFVVNTTTRQYEGFRYGSYCKLGVLADTPDDSLKQYSPAADTLTTFAGGINPLFDCTNRTTSQGGCVHNIAGQRTTYLGGADGLPKGVSPGGPVFKGNDDVSVLNWLYSNYSLTNGGLLDKVEMELVPGETTCFDIRAESVTGAPTAASLTASFQFGPLDFTGLTLAQTTSSLTRPYQTTTASDGFLSSQLLNGDWPAVLADQTLAAPRSITRCVKAGPNARFLKVPITATLTGGSTPAFVLTVATSTFKSDGGSGGGSTSGAASTVAIDQSVSGTSNAVVVAGGNVASATSDSGNPVKIAGVNNTTPPTFTDGQRGDLQIGTRGSLRVEIVGAGATSGSTVTGSGADGASNNTAGLTVYSRSNIYNGTTWDRILSIANGLNSTGTGIAPAGLVAQLDDTSPTTITENLFGNLRMSTNRALLTRQFASSAQDWTYAAASGGISNSTTAVTMVAATASVRNYLTACQISSDALGAATELVVRDGAAGTVLTRMKIGTAGLTPTNIEFPTPLKSTVNTLLEVVTLTATVTGGIYVNCQGYTAP